MEGQHYGMDRPVDVVIAAHRRRKKSMSSHHRGGIRRMTPQTHGRHGQANSSQRDLDIILAECLKSAKLYNFIIITENNQLVS